MPSIPRRSLLPLLAGLTACASVPEVPSQPNRPIASILAADDAFLRFIEASNRAGTLAELGGSGPITVFAFTNSGWGDLPAFTQQSLLGGSEPLRVQALMRSLIVEGRHPVPQGREVTLTSLNGTRLKIDAREGGTARIESAGGTGMSVGLGSIGLRSARLARQDIQAANGILHIMDGMLVP
ncbi:fasciclin domain-containing protein [Falsiroseomonas selenitidurans]|uniref:Fasciclin domain-containing protein n=1 Tax=Falsiroseomonas selenitidurans TaxID=2716335 RepID=A0ABX1E8L9_9PROT|nr:fasciclin domain-containing protein [Falsiroseomonas selenitidurans]NKC33560.1 fasciclin domain-containing protein [Falsiroseomonas selenitidurans]